MENRVIAILGCTASGKGAVGRTLAAHIGGEIVSVDSMKVYRGLDIGTAKPTPDQRAAVPHHLIDVADPWEPFSAARFVELADAAVAEIHARGRPIVAVGGTGMYFKFFYEGTFEGPSADAALRGELRDRAQREGVAALHAELTAVDPAAAARIHANDLRRIERALEVFRLTGTPISALQQQWSGGRVRRPEWRWTLIGLRRPREEANRRINERVRRMIAAGLVDEARRIWTDPRGVSVQARQAVGYAELFDVFEREPVGASMTEAQRVATIEDATDDTTADAIDDTTADASDDTTGDAINRAIEQIKIHSRRLTKHQRTWLRRMADVHWIDVSSDEAVEAVVDRVRTEALV